MANSKGSGNSGATKAAGGAGKGTGAGGKAGKGYGAPGGWPSTKTGVPSGKNRGNAPAKQP